MSSWASPFLLKIIEKGLFLLLFSGRWLRGRRKEVVFADGLPLRGLKSLANWRILFKHGPFYCIRTSFSQLLHRLPLFFGNYTTWLPRENSFGTAGPRVGRFLLFKSQAVIWSRHFSSFNKLRRLRLFVQNERDRWGVRVYRRTHSWLQMGRKSTVSLILVFAGWGTRGRIPTILVVLGGCARWMTVFRLFVGERCWFWGWAGVLVSDRSQVSSFLVVLSMEWQAISLISFFFLPVSLFSSSRARIYRTLKVTSPIMVAFFRARLLGNTLFRRSLRLHFATVFNFSPRVLVLGLRVRFGLIMFFWSVNITSLQITVLLHCSLFCCLFCISVRICG